MPAPFDVVPIGTGDLKEFLKKYWNKRLSDSPCTNKIDGKITIGEQIPNYAFSYNDLVVARKSFTGIKNDSCQNTGLITDNKITVSEGKEIFIVVGSSVFSEYDTSYLLYYYLGEETQPSELVDQELDAVMEDQMRVEIDGSAVDADKIKRIGPEDFKLTVSQNSPVADKMEYPIGVGKKYDASVGGHVVVIKINQEGNHNVHVDFDGLRGYKNRVRTEVKVQ